jgi:hypothetical protein
VPNSLLSRALLGMLPDTDQTLKTTDRSCWGEGAYERRPRTGVAEERGRGTGYAWQTTDMKTPKQVYKLSFL